MKRIVLLLSFILICNFASAQTEKQNVERDFIAYSKLIIDRKVDNALEYVNPKIFEVFPKEVMVSLMEAVHKMPNIEYKLSLPIIDSISDVKRIDNIDYVKIKTISPIEMKFTDMDLTDEKKRVLLQDSFESKFGKGNVVYNKATGFFKINVNKEIVGSSTDNQVSWKFITVDNPKMKGLLAKVLPSEILE